MRKSLSRSMLLCVLGLAACNHEPGAPLEESPAPESASVGRQARAVCDEVVVPTMPAMPKAPLDLSTYVWGTPLYPRTVASAYTVMIQDPADPGYFLAYGFDVTNRALVFWARGVRGRHEASFHRQVGEDLGVIQSRGATDFWVGGSSQADKPTPTPVGPSTHDWAWRLAYKLYALHRGSY